MIDDLSSTIITFRNNGQKRSRDSRGNRGAGHSVFAFLQLSFMQMILQRMLSRSGLVSVSTGFLFELASCQAPAVGWIVRAEPMENPRWHSRQVESVTERALQKIKRLFNELNLSQQEKQQRLESLAIDVTHIFDCAEARYKKDMGLEVLDEGQLRKECVAISLEIMGCMEQIQKKMNKLDELQPFLRMRQLQSWREELEKKKSDFKQLLENQILEMESALSILGENTQDQFKHIHYQGYYHTDNTLRLCSIIFGCFRCRLSSSWILEMQKYHRKANDDLVLNTRHHALQALFNLKNA